MGGERAGSGRERPRDSLGAGVDRGVPVVEMACHEPDHKALAPITHNDIHHLLIRALTNLFHTSDNPVSEWANFVKTTSSMTAMTRTVILNAFSPAQELLDPARFAGRKNEIRELTDALRVQGSVPVIYGDRGLGKSSLAVQLQLIAMGDSELLESLGIKALGLDGEEVFMTFYVSCNDQVQSLEDLQFLIIHKLEAVDLVTSGPHSKDLLIDRSTRRKLSLKLFEAETTRSYSERAQRLRFDELTPHERLERELGILWDAFGFPVLIIIDELDRAKSLEGLAPYLKSASTDQLKIVLVGIAHTLSDLSLDHPSIERQLIPIRLPRMSMGELADIVDKALNKLRTDGQGYRITADARRRLVRLSGGFPWFIHVIGQSALIAVADAGRFVVEDDDVIQSSRNLVLSRFSQQFRAAYERAVRDSCQREIVLRVCAAWSTSDIPTTEVYPVCRRLGVSNPAVYRGHLTAERYGEPLMVPGSHSKVLLRFRNEMFRQYVNLVSSTFTDVDIKVRQETSTW